MLLAVKAYLQEHDQASLQELSAYLHVSSSAMRDMLNRLLRCGRIARVEKPDGCGSSCQQCAIGFVGDQYRLV